MPDQSRFPWWIPAGGLLLAALYLPTLATPFDFIDDGNLVYPAASGLSRFFRPIFPVDLSDYQIDQFCEQRAEN